MKTILTAIAVCFCLTTIHAQTFDLNISQFTGCGGQVVTSSTDGEPQTRITLSSTQVETYFYGVANRAKSSAWALTTTSTSTTNDPVFGTIYVYNTASYAKGNAVVKYVPKEKIVEITWEKTGCVMVFTIY